ncbi:MAG: amidase domain-containing protein [Clostridiaceae bacterium]|nr:amidase domain-containing protein [Clostridiaceae bacterium]
MVLCAVFVLVILLIAITFNYRAEDADVPEITDVFTEEELSQVLHQIFYVRNKSMLEGDVDVVKVLYDTNTKYGLWAYEHEVKKTKYLHHWSDKQGVKFKDINTKFFIRSVKGKGDKVTVNFVASTEYTYTYVNEPEAVNLFRIGTYHILDMVFRNEQWTIVREWYTDPFADSLNLENIKSDEIKEYILTSKPKDISGISVKRIQAVEYADRYCGAAANEEYGFSYNKEYRDYNPEGGDCANFASQILFEGGGFKKTAAWNYDKGGATKAWVNAQAFKNYMLNSGRGYKIAYGSYNDVYKAAYKLLPGDFIAYEKKGKVTHISVVTGMDSKGYPLVNCHNTDRYRVPWDLGWSNKNIKFWLVRVNYP